MVMSGRIRMENHYGWQELQKRKDREIRVTEIREISSGDYLGRGARGRRDRKSPKYKVRALCVEQVREDASDDDGQGEISDLGVLTRIVF